MFIEICCDEFRDRAKKVPNPGDHATVYFYDCFEGKVYFFNTNEFISLRKKDKVDYCPFCKKKFKFC